MQIERSASGTVPPGTSDRSAACMSYTPVRPNSPYTITSSPPPGAAARSADLVDLGEPEEVLSPRHARTGDIYYPRRTGPMGDPQAETARREALWEREQDPWVVGEGRLKAARVHPFSVLLAKTQY